METNTKRQILAILLEIDEIEQSLSLPYNDSFCQMVAHLLFDLKLDLSHQTFWQTSDEQFLAAASKYRNRLQGLVSIRGTECTDIICAFCHKSLAKNRDEKDTFDPVPEQLESYGYIAVPNFGWFCSQVCADAYEAATGTKFQRDAEGFVNYK